jgi:hypothetical protein
MMGRRILGCGSEGLFLARDPDAAPVDLIYDLFFAGSVNRL